MNLRVILSILIYCYCSKTCNQADPFKPKKLKSIPVLPNTGESSSPYLSHSPVNQSRGTMTSQQQDRAMCNRPVGSKMPLLDEIGIEETLSMEASSTSNEVESTSNEVESIHEVVQKFLTAIRTDNSSEIQYLLGIYSGQLNEKITVRVKKKNKPKLKQMQCLHFIILKSAKNLSIAELIINYLTKDQVDALLAVPEKEQNPQLWMKIKALESKVKVYTQRPGGIG